MTSASDNVRGVILMISSEELRALVSGAVEAGVTKAFVAWTSSERDKPLSLREASEFLGISADALRQHVSRGNIAPIHRGSRGGGMRGHRFSREDLLAFVQRNRKVER